MQPGSAGFDFDNSLAETRAPKKASVPAVFWGFISQKNRAGMFIRHIHPRALCVTTLAMPTRLHRYYGAGYSHFITTSCYRRLPLLGSARNRDLFLQVLEQTRRCYRFVVVGYVVMPEHVHLLLTEPERANPSVVMQALKQSFARKLLRRVRARVDSRQNTLWSSPLEGGHIWQARFYDFVVFSEHKRIEKLRYIHLNPVKRGLALEPQQWRWSSYRHYAYAESGPVVVNEPRIAELRIRDVA
jgi:putative transposase